MSKTALIVALTVAVVLGLLVWLSGTLGGPPQSAQPQSGEASGEAPMDTVAPSPEAGVDVIFELDPAAVRTIAVEREPGAPAERVTRSADGRWTFNAPNAAEWPAESARIREALRNAERIVAAGRVEPGDAPPADAPVVRFLMNDGSERTLRFGAEAFGGRTLAQVGGDDGRIALINAAAVTPLIEPGPAGWRLTRAIPGMGRDVSRVTIESSIGRLALARLQGEWTLRAPVPARADEGRVFGLIDALAGVDVERFVDPQRFDERSAGLDEPEMRVIVERDVRTPGDDGVRIETLRRELRFGGATGSSTLNALALEADDRPASRQPLIVDRGELGSVSSVIEPVQYLSRTASGVFGPDVRSVTVRTLAGDAQGERRYRRDLDTWQEQTDAGTQPIDLPTARSIDALVDVLTRVEGAPMIAPVLESWHTLARVELAVAGDSGPAEIVTVGYDADGNLVLRNGAIAWTYENADPPAVLRLPPPGAVEPEAPRPEPTNMPADPMAK